MNYSIPLLQSVPLQFFAGEPQFRATAQEGIAWIFSPLKAWIPTTELTHGLPWYFLDIPMEAKTVGYLDLRVMAIDIIILVLLIVALPYIATKRSRDSHIAALVSAIIGIAFGISIFAWNTITWPFAVNGGIIRLAPLIVALFLAITSIALQLRLKHSAQ